MGIPGYFAAVRRKCPTAVIAAGSSAYASGVPNFDVLYLDFNCLVHLGVTQDSTSDDVIERAIDGLSRVIEEVSPRKSVHVCADGVPPEAKIAQQRTRRFMAAKERAMFKREGFDRNAITPGTPFVKRLDASMRLACERLTNSNLEVTYSGTDVPGEGEQKIMSLIRNDTDGSSACVYGLDADLLVLCSCLAAQGIPVPWLCREEHDDCSLTFVNARTVARHSAGKDTPRSLWNHVVCSFFCGNDFLPPLSCLSMDRTEDWHGKMRKICQTSDLSLVTDDDQLNWKDVGELLGQLATTEDTDFERVDSSYWKSRPNVSTPEEAWDNYPMVNKNNRHRIIRPGEPDWRSRYYSTLFGLRSENGINRITGEFIRGVQWAFEYYKGGNGHVSWRYPYEYGPTSLDLYNAVASCDGSPPPADLSMLEPVVSTPEQLLAFVTPVIGTETAPTLAHPLDAELATYLKRKVWECKPILPPAVSYGTVD